MKNEIKKVLVLQAHEEDKLNLFSSIYKYLENNDVRCIVTAFNLYEKERYLKKKVKGVQYIPKILKTYNLNLAKEYKKYDNLEEMIKFNIKINELNQYKIEKNRYIRIAKLFLEYLSEQFNNGLTKIVMWNNTFLFDRIAYFFAKKNNIEMVILEQGIFRPFTLTMDRQGVNYENSVPRDAEFYRNLKYNKNILIKYLNNPISFKLNDCKSKTKSNNYLKLKSKLENTILSKFLKYQEDCSLINEKILNKIFRKFDRISYNKKEYIEKYVFDKDYRYVFIPFQVHDDSQIILNSPNIKSMDKLVEIIDIASREMDANIKFIFKEHPADKGRIDYKSLYDKYKSNNKLLFLNNIDTNKLIDICECIITVNSTVGIEALMNNKKVITLGDAFYNINGIVNHCDNVNKLSKCIKETIKYEFDKTLKDGFLYYLRFIYQHEIFWRNPNKEQLEVIVNFILEE